MPKPQDYDGGLNNVINNKKQDNMNMDFNVKTRQGGEKLPQTLQDECNALENLIVKRDYWLRQDVNKCKSHYAAVAADTNELRLKLLALKKELTTPVKADTVGSRKQTPRKQRVKQSKTN